MGGKTGEAKQCSKRKLYDSLNDVLLIFTNIIKYNIYSALAMNKE